MVRAVVNIPDEIDRFIGDVKEERGLNTKNEALNFIVREYREMSKSSEEKEEEIEMNKLKKKPRKLRKNHVHEIKDALNGDD